MRVLNRLRFLAAARLNDVFDQLDGPESRLRQALREMEHAIAEASARAAKLIAAETILARRLAEQERQVGAWTARAECAIVAGEDQLARRALRRKRDHEALVRALGDEAEAAHAASLGLRGRLELMKATHAEARLRLTALQARYRGAAARRASLRGVVASSREVDGFSLFQQAREEVEHAEAEADALAELADGHDTSDPLGAPPTAEGEDRIDEELESLRRRVFGGARAEESADAPGG